MKRSPAVAALVASAALSLVLAGGCGWGKREPPEAAEAAPAGAEAPRAARGGVPSPVGMDRLPVEEALRLAKLELGRTSGQWRVESVRRIDRGWELHFLSRSKPADYRGNCRITVTDAGRVSAAPAGGLSLKPGF